MMIRPFDVAVPDEVLDDLRRRLRSVRLPSDPVLDRLGGRRQPGPRCAASSITGCTGSIGGGGRTSSIASHHGVASVEGHDVHFVHQRGVGPAPLPLVMTHGWPGSFAEMERVIPLLSDPGTHGGDPRDAFDVVVPSLPGYGFSQAPAHPGVGARTIAGTWKALMNGLGYGTFGAQGGDIGAGVSLWLARETPEAVVGVHLNYVPGGYRPNLVGAAPPSDDERAFLDGAARFAAEEGAYATLQATKPQTLAFALADSPFGLAAWMTEKFSAWSDHGGDVERVISLDSILTNVMLHWSSGNAAGGTCASIRRTGSTRSPSCPNERVAVPVGVAAFPRELPMPPRSWLERGFDVRRWTTMPRGGHFAALEQPELLVDDVRAFFRGDPLTVPRRNRAGRQPRP